MPTEATLSYSHGASASPLLGETIGANLGRVAAAHPDAEVLVDVPTGRRWTYAAFDEATDTLARGLIAAGLAAGDRVGIWAPNCAEWVQLQYATAKAGIILVNINPAYRSHELGFALRQSGVRVLVSAERFKTSDYRAMIDEVRPELSELEDVVFLGTPAWDAFSEAGHAVAPQHPEQRPVHRRRLPVYRGRPGLHPCAVLPLFRNGPRQPGLYDARRVHRHPGAWLRPGGDAALRPARALHLAVRGADDVHRGARAARLRQL